MIFSPASYGPAVEGFLTGVQGPTHLATAEALTLFPGAPHPREALAGLWLLFDDLDRSHTASQELSSPEAAFWHGIMHRREPDPSNAAYWFRGVSRHAVFPALREDAVAAGYRSKGADWDPFAWIDYWELARRKPGSAEHAVAMAVQRVEWEILFDYCARPGK